MATVLVAILVAALGAGGSIFLLGGHSKATVSATSLHDQKTAKRGAISPATKPEADKTVRIARRTQSASPALATVQTPNFFQAAQTIVRTHWGQGVLSDSHVSLSVPCDSGYAVVIWSAPHRLASIEIWLRSDGGGWRAISADYSHYGSSGQALSVDHLRGGHKPSGISCFQ